MLVLKKDYFVDKKWLIIKLVNIRSLNKNTVDLACHKRLKRSDIICLTETQLQQNLSLSKSYMLEEFNIIIYNNNCDKFQSIACGFWNDIDILLHNRTKGASLVSFSKSTFEKKTIKLLLLYRKYSISVTTFCNWLEFLTNDFVDIILGDFNINAFDDTDRLSSVLDSYNQII